MTVADNAEIEYVSPWVCGEHFCEDCGDCLACYSGDSCRDEGEHIYANPDDEWAYMAFTWHKGADGRPTRDPDNHWTSDTTEGD